MGSKVQEPKNQRTKRIPALVVWFFGSWFFCHSAVADESPVLTAVVAHLDDELPPLRLGHRETNDLPTLTDEELGTAQQQSLLTALAGDPYGHRAADPVLLMADDGLMGMDLRPGAQNKGGVNSDGRPLVHTLPTGDIQISKEMMGEERSIIDDVFLVSLFKVLSENPNMTATQVIELVNEKGMLVAPTLGRQHSEYIGGMVPRELDLAAHMTSVGIPVLDPMPPRLKEAMGKYEITDTSPLSKAANAIASHRIPGRDRIGLNVLERN
jgi:hypothetical protein